MQNFFDVVQTRTGDAISGAFVSVYDSTNALATIYSDDGVTLQTNPMTTNTDGEYSFFAANGTYSLVITAAGYTGQTRSGIVLYDATAALPMIASVDQFGAVGNGVTDDAAAFDDAGNSAALVYIPKPATGYTFSTPTTNTNASFWPDPTTTWDNLTDGGVFNWGRTTGNGDSAIWRFADRVYVGSAAYQFAGNSFSSDGGNSWMSDKNTAPAYLAINANLLSIAHQSPYAIVGAARSSDHINNGNTAIGFGSAVKNDVTSGNAWAYIAEIQHETGANISFGMEIGAKHKSSTNPTAVAPYVAGGGVMGLWFAGGGDNRFGGAATYPANAAMVVLNNSQSGLSAGWKKGLVFKSDALEGTDGSVGSTTTAIAIDMARRHAIRWSEPTNNSTGAQISSAVTANAYAVQILFKDSEIDFVDRTGAVFVYFINGGDDAPSLRSSTGQARYEASGTSTNIDVYLVPKGTGVVKFGTHSALAGETVSGYITIKDANGTTRKLAVVS